MAERTVRTQNWWPRYGWTTTKSCSIRTAQVRATPRLETSAADAHSGTVFNAMTFSGEYSRSLFI